MTPENGVYVRVEVGDEVYAIPVESVLEIADAGEVTAVPGAGPAVVGVRNLRGSILPVFRLAALLGLPSASGGTRIVVTECDGLRAALAVDAVSDVGALSPADEETSSELLAGAALENGTLIGIVDVRRVFAALGEDAA
jgi:purine-binding chemotaxis protein CheW